jgi:hypothetical protein
VPGHPQRQPFPRRHPAGRPSWRAERADEREAADAAGNPRRACRGERPAGRDAQQRRRLGPHPVQHQRRILRPIRQPAQSARISAADAGPVRGHDAQSQLAGCLGEQARRQPRIGQPVAQQNRRRALLASDLNRDHAAVAPAHLHRPMVSRPGRPPPACRPGQRPCLRQRGRAGESWIFPAEPGAHRLGQSSQSATGGASSPRCAGTPERRIGANSPAVISRQTPQADYLLRARCRSRLVRQSCWTRGAIRVEAGHSCSWLGRFARCQELRFQSVCIGCRASTRTKWPVRLPARCQIVQVTAGVLALHARSP